MIYDICIVFLDLVSSRKSGTYLANDALATTFHSGQTQPNLFGINPLSFPSKDSHLLPFLILPYPHSANKRLPSPAKRSGECWELPQWSSCKTHFIIF